MCVHQRTNWSVIDDITVQSPPRSHQGFSFIKIMFRLLLNPSDLLNSVFILMSSFSHISHVCVSWCSEPISWLFTVLGWSLSWISYSQHVFTHIVVAEWLKPQINNRKSWSFPLVFPFWVVWSWMFLRSCWIKLQ